LAADSDAAGNAGCVLFLSSTVYFQHGEMELWPTPQR
jgi:hypothetical protein